MADDRHHAKHTNDQRDYQRAKSLRRALSPAERLLWNDLRSLPNDLTLKFRRQHPIHPYIVDFACVSCKLVVEIDGESHDMRQPHDEQRSKYLQQKGYTVMRFTNEAVYRNREGVVQEIVRKSQELLDAMLQPRP